MRTRKIVLVAGLVLAAGALYWADPELFGKEEEEGRATARTLQLAAGPAPARLPAPVPGQTARSAVVMIGDGLGIAGIEASRLLNAGIGGSLQLDRFPVVGLSTTRSAIDVKTDSAAGATALATGSKTLNGRLGVDPANRRLRDLVEAAKAAGKAVGLVTDSYLWDATPGGFSIHNVSRRNYQEIAIAMAGQDIDLLAGCEAKRFADDDAAEGPVLTAFAGQGYAIGHDAGFLDQAPPGRVLALFPAGTLTPQEGQSQLSRVVAAALERLGKAPNGFFLLVESEETDSGGHDNDIDRVTRGVAALDGTLEKVFASAQADGQTLVVWTADHETGGLAIVGGKEGKPLRYVFATEGHNAEPVPLFAFGPGAERFAGTRDNTAVAKDLAAALGLDLAPPLPRPE